MKVRMTRLAWVLLILVVLFAAQLVWAALKADAAELDLTQAEVEAVAASTTFAGSSGTLTVTTKTASVTCWRWEKSPPWASVSRLGPRYRFTLFAEWCGNGRKVTSLRSLICKDAGGGFFTYDRCWKEHGSVGFINLNVTARWHYYTTVWVPFAVVINRNPHVNMWLGPKGGVSGTVWYN